MNDPVLDNFKNESFVCEGTFRIRPVRESRLCPHGRCWVTENMVNLIGQTFEFKSSNEFADGHRAKYWKLADNSMFNGIYRFTKWHESWLEPV